MNKVYYYILTICFVPFLVGCNEKKILPMEEEDLIEVPLLFSGDITVAETPLDTRASSSNDLYGIQVYQEGKNYAYGLFDNASNLKLYLHSGKKYKVICSLVKNGKHSLKFLEDRGKGRDYNYYYGRGLDYIDGGAIILYVEEDKPGYGHPFAITSNECSDPSSYTDNWDGSSPMNVSNRFIYSSSESMAYLSSGRVITTETTGYSGKLPRSPLIDRYYGESDSFTPSTNSILSINLKRVSYSIKYAVSGITDGSASITINNANRTFFDDSGLTVSHESEEIVCCFDDILDAWKYADDYTENLTVSMKWMRGVGIEQDLGSQMIQVKRGAVNVVEIALDTN